jgi:hypothetical protein
MTIPNVFAKLSRTGGDRGCNWSIIYYNGEHGNKRRGNDAID